MCKITESGLVQMYRIHHRKKKVGDNYSSISCSYWMITNHLLFDEDGSGHDPTDPTSITSWL